MKVVVLTTLRHERIGECQEAVRRWADAGDEVRLITMHPYDASAWPVAGMVVLGPPTTGARFGTLSRALVRVYPGSPGRQLRRRVRASAEARAALEGADLVASADTPAVLALWWSSRRHPSAPHIAGLGSALQQRR